MRLPTIALMTRLGATATALAATLALALTACGEGGATAQEQGFQHWWPSTPIPTPGPGGPSTPTAQATATPASAGQAQSSGLGTPAEKVSATADLKFAPAATSAKTGDVIQWTNTGNVAHNVTFDSNTDLNSQTLQQGDTWAVKFTAPGTYAYHCTFHPGMDGQITVAG